MNWEFFALTIALTNAFVNSYFINNVSDFIKDHIEIIGEGLTCSMCVGFWSGVLFSFSSYNIGPWWYCGLLSSLANYIFGVAIERILHEVSSR